MPLRADQAPYEASRPRGRPARPEPKGTGGRQCRPPMEEFLSHMGAATIWAAQVKRRDVGEAQRREYAAELQAWVLVMDKLTTRLLGRRLEDILNQVLPPTPEQGVAQGAAPFKPAAASEADSTGTCVAFGQEPSGVVGNGLQPGRRVALDERALHEQAPGPDGAPPAGATTRSTTELDWQPGADFSPDEQAPDEQAHQPDDLAPVPATATCGDEPGSQAARAESGDETRGLEVSVEDREPAQVDSLPTQGGSGPALPNDPGHPEPSPRPALPLALTASPAGSRHWLRASEVHAQAVAWLWPPYVPLGKVTDLVGYEGEGKTYLALWLATAVTRGHPLPHPNHETGELIYGPVGKPGTVLYLVGEDSLADTIRPRLEAMGADLDRVALATSTGSEDLAPLTLQDADALEQVVRAVRPSLLVIDPIQAFFPHGRSMARAESVRLVMMGLHRLAEHYHLAVLVIRHLRKGASGRAAHQGLGSVDFVAAARSQLLVATDPTDPDVRVLIHVKSNLARRAPALTFRLQGGHVVWMGITPITAEDALRAYRAGRGPSRREEKAAEATQWLQDLLANGPVPSATIWKRAQAAGISDRQLRKAQDRLRVQVVRESQGNRGRGRWWWVLPNAQVAVNGAQDGSAGVRLPLLAPLHTPPASTSS